MIRDGVVAGSREPMAVNNSPVVSYRNADLKLDKIVFRSNKGKKKRVCNIPKSYHRYYIQI